MFGLIVPIKLGGAELDLCTWTDTLAELSYADGSIGWTVLANSTSAAFASAYLADSAAEQMFASPIAIAGQYSPRGHAVARTGGYDVSGTYSFGSGSAHAEWIGGGCTESRNGKTSLDADGVPLRRVFFLPRQRVQFEENWDVMGLRGTGSYDYSVSDFVDEEHTFVFTDPPLRGGAMYRVGAPILGSAGHGGWALGCARRALDEVVRASYVQLNRASGPNAEKEGFLHDAGRHHAALNAARAYLHDTFGELGTQMADGIDVSREHQIRTYGALTYCTRVCLEAVRFAWDWSQTAVIREGVMQRCYRDMSVGALHITQSRHQLVAVGTQLVEAASRP